MLKFPAPNIQEKLCPAKWVAKVCPWEVEFLERFSRDLYTFITAMLLLMAEIRRSPVEVGSLSHYLRRVLYIPGGDRQISEPSTFFSITRFGWPSCNMWMPVFSIGIQDRSTPQAPGCNRHQDFSALGLAPESQPRPKPSICDCCGG